MIVPVSNYVVACILFAALLVYVIYGLYWISVNGKRIIPEPTPPHGCTGAGYTGTVIIKDTKSNDDTDNHNHDDTEPPNTPPNTPPNICTIQSIGTDTVPRRSSRRYKGKHFKKRKIPFAK